MSHAPAAGAHRTSCRSARPVEPAGLSDFRDGLDPFNDDPSQNPEHLHLWPSFAEAAAALDAPKALFGDRPVVVLTAASNSATRLGLPAELAATIDPLWAAAHQELADESTSGTRDVVDGAGHEIQEIGLRR